MGRGGQGRLLRKRFSEWLEVKNTVLRAHTQIKTPSRLGSKVEAGRA